MKTTNGILLTLSCLAAMSGIAPLPFAGSITAAAAAATPPARERPQEQPRLYWYTDLDVALASAARQGKPIAVFFTSPECPYSREMERATLDAPRIVALSSRYVWVKIDVTTVKGAAIAERNDVTATPTLILYNQRKDAYDRIEGLIYSTALYQRLQAVLFGE